MAEITHRNVKTNGITLHVAEAGAGKPVILCHGFPSVLELPHCWDAPRELGA